MEGLKQYLYAEELFSRDGTFRIASSLAEYVAAGDWTRYFSVLTDIKEASPKDVRGALSRYLIKSQAVIGTIEKPAS